MANKIGAAKKADQAKEETVREKTNKELDNAEVIYELDTGYLEEDAERQAEFYAVVKQSVEDEREDALDDSEEQAVLAALLDEKAHSQPIEVPYLAELPAESPAPEPKPALKLRFTEVDQVFQNLLDGPEFHRDLENTIANDETLSQEDKVKFRKAVKLVKTNKDVQNQCVAALAAHSKALAPQAVVTPKPRLTPSSAPNLQPRPQPRSDMERFLARLVKVAYARDSRLLGLVRHPSLSLLLLNARFSTKVEALAKLFNAHGCGFDCEPRNEFTVL